MPSLKNSLSQFTEFRSKVSGTAADICKAGALVEMAKSFYAVNIGQLKSKQELLFAMRQGITDLFNSGETFGLTALAGLYGTAGEIVLKATSSIEDEIEKRRNKIEFVLNLIYNAKSEFYLAVAQYLVDRMRDELNIIKEEIANIEDMIERMNTALSLISRLINSIGEGSVRDIENPREYLLRAIDWVNISEQTLQRSGFVFQKDIDGIRREIAYALVELDRANKKFGNINVITQQGVSNLNIQAVLSPQLQELLLILDDLGNDMETFLDRYSRIEIAYKKAQYYRDIFLALPDTIKVTQAASAIGLYGKNLDYLEERLDGIAGDMDEFIESGDHSTPKVQFKRNQYKLHALQLLKYVNASFGNLANIEDDIRRAGTYQQLRRLLENRDFFEKRGAELIDKFKLEIIQTSVSFLKLITFDRDKLVLLRGRVKNLDIITGFLKREVWALGEDIKIFGPHYSQKLDQIVFILRGLGIDEPAEMIASGKIGGIATLISDVSFSASAGASCLSGVLEKLKITNPNDVKKLQEGENLLDEMKQRSDTLIFEENYNPVNALIENEAHLGKRIKENQSRIESLENIQGGFLP